MPPAREQVVLVTGCSSGIGRAIALDAAARGHLVWATARSPGTLESFRAQERIRTSPLDVTDRRSIASALGRVLERDGRLDALVNNAGYAQYGAAEQVSEEEWRKQFDVNFFGVVETTRAALPALRSAGRATVVNISSVGGRIVVPFAAPYCSSKHALEALSDALRVELAPFGVRVVVVEPGPIESRFAERARRGVAPLLADPGPYASLYPGAERAMGDEFQRGRLPASAVARVVVDAIEAERPRARYRVTAMARLLLPLSRVLPDRLVDAAMRRALRLPDRA
jgi:NAD(P)-dependent dehydrogenase (short-subunit alcohol dehydrogenase family)